MNSTSRGESSARCWTRSAVPVFDYSLACQAIPLIRRIARDIVNRNDLLRASREELRQRSQGNAVLTPRQRFQLEDAVRELRAQLRSLIDELHRVGVTLLDPSLGEVGFPTIVNGSLAYLVYRTTDDAVQSWRYRDQRRLRPLPVHWKTTSLAQEPTEEEGLLI